MWPGAVLQCYQQQTLQGRRVQYVGTNTKWHRGFPLQMFPTHDSCNNCISYFPSTFVETIFALPMLVVVTLDMFLFVKNLKWYGAGQQCGCSEMIGRAWNYSNHLREVRISVPGTLGLQNSPSTSMSDHWQS